ncbi:MAG: oligoendopeptidase F, partial [Acidobacteriota bacterium]|nr:oligoendopeptidase F [Acidobacteriota bacterium]
MSDVLTRPARVQKPWSLAELLPDTSAELVSTRLAEIEAVVESIEAARGRLESSPSRELVVEALEDFEDLTERTYVLSGFGQLWFSEDTQSEAALAYKNRLSRLLVDLHNRVLFFPLWWKGLDDATATALAPDKAAHPDFFHFLEDLRRTRPFMLEERSEQIVNLKDSHGISAVLTIYSMLTNRLEFELEVDGETKLLTRDGLLAYVYSPDATIRAGAYREMLAVFGAEAKILGQIYVSRVLDWHAE